MAGRGRYFLRSLPTTFVRYFVIGIALSFILVLVQIPSGNSSQSISLAQEAKTLTTQGHQHLHQGHPAQALKAWEQATRLYRQLNQPESIKGSLVNESLAHQALGQNHLACTNLANALELSSQICPNPTQGPASANSATLSKEISTIPPAKLNAIALQNLGDVLRLSGNVEQARQAQVAALSMADDASRDRIRLSLANTHRDLYTQSREQYLFFGDPLSKKQALASAQSNADKAINLYEQVGQTGGEAGLKAQLNQLSLLIAIRESELPSLQINTNSIASLAQNLSTVDYSFNSPIDSVYAQLNLSESLLKLDPKLPILGQGALARAESIAQSALAKAQNTTDDRARSYAFGTLAKVHQKQGNSRQAITEFKRGLQIAQSTSAWDIAYQWQELLGLLYQTSGNRAQSIGYFEAAVNSLDQVRGSILAVNPDFQFSFREQVAPIYKEYMRLLMDNGNPNLEKVIQTNERLQIAQLENFLQCGKLDLISLNEVTTAPSATIIHLIDLGNKVELIVHTASGEYHRYTPDAKKLTAALNNLFVNLQTESLPASNKDLIQGYSKAVYNLIVAPIKNNGWIPQSGTLVFVLDESLQALPPGILYDGEHYLVETYDVAITPTAQLRPPKPLGKEQFSSLIGALSERAPSYPEGITALPEVTAEVEDIKQTMRSTETLLNQEFTASGLQQAHSHPIVHVATHAQFSSDRDQTLILAWDKPIKLQQFNQILKNQENIELLVLSACQTAKGDKRSVLGLAGIAAQAGARSTLASLWLVDSAATTKLMGAFYQNLKQGKSKSAALREAQLSLLATPEYNHPYYWSGFVLLGSWI